MQERRSNVDRSRQTTTSLIAVARKLFVEKGYAETGTPDLVAAAGLTRGALYHHFADKRALFRAVVEAESRAVAAEVEAAAPGGTAPLRDLLVGGEAYLDAMAVPGRVRLLLIDAPSVLGAAETAAIDARHAGRTLREGIDAALASGLMRVVPAEALTVLLSAAYDRAALAISEGKVPRDHCSVAMAALLEGLSVGVAPL